MKPYADDDALLLKSLQEAVREALDRKRLLGQYAVVWRDGRPVFIGPNPPVDPYRCPAAPMRSFDGVAEPDDD